MGKEYYLVFLGENDIPRNTKVLSRMKSLGNSMSIAPNIHVITIEKSKGLKVADIRNTLCGEEKTMLLVVSLDNISGSAWILTKEGSDFLLSKYSEING